MINIGNPLRFFASKIGMDGAIAYSSGARVIQGFAGVGSIFFISTFLSGIEQGFYFTFASILALQVFFELGLTGIMTQYVAHEASHLQLNEDAEYVGEKNYLSRLASLVHFCVKWYSVISVFAFIFLLIAGFFYFTRYGDTQTSEVKWHTPWTLICAGTALQLFISPLTSILNGLGFVRQMAKISFWQQVIIPLTTWTGLACGLKLYVTGIGYIVSSIIWIAFVCRMGLMSILLKLWKVEIIERVDYIKEIFPYQWKIALSWMSGYLIGQLFNPVLFATAGAVAAGQMGMTLQALNAIQAFSLSWLNTKIPLYSKLIALKKYVKLDDCFNKTLRQMSVVCLLLLSFFFLTIIVLRLTKLQINGNIFAERFLDYGPMLFMMVPVFLQQYTASWATYLRCHKKEPFLILSIVSGVFCMLSTFAFGKAFGIWGVSIGYCLVTIVLFPWGNFIFRTKKKQWHTD